MRNSQRFSARFSPWSPNITSELRSLRYTPSARTGYTPLRVCGFRIPRRDCPKISKNIFSTKNVPHGKKIVFTRQNSFLRWVAKKYFFTHGPRGPRPHGSTLPEDCQIRDPVSHFSHFLAFSAIFGAIFATFPPNKPFGSTISSPPFERIPEDSRAGIRHRGPNFLPRLPKNDSRSGKRGHGSSQK